MAFAPKIDFSGLSTIFSGKLKIRDTVYNGSNDSYEPLDTDGSVAEVEPYGRASAPVVNFAVVADITAAAGAVKLGKITGANSPDGEPDDSYQLNALNISTSAGGEPTLSTSSTMVENGASDDGYFEIPAFTLKKRHEAQILFGAFTLPTGVILSSCSAVGSSEAKPTIVEGVTVASDVGGGMVVVTASFTAKSTTEISALQNIAATSGWTKRTICVGGENPETSKPTITLEFVKPLVKTYA